MGMWYIYNFTLFEKSALKCNLNAILSEYHIHSVNDIYSNFNFEYYKVHFINFTANSVN